MTTSLLERPMIPSDPLDHLQALAAAGADVLDHLDLLASCRFGPPATLEAAVDDLRGRLATLDSLSPRSTGLSIDALVERAADHEALARTLAVSVRSTVRQIHEQSGALALELRRALADTSGVVATAVGGAGTYDSAGRSQPGPLRRPRGLG